MYQHSFFVFRLRKGDEEAANYNSSDDEERPGPEGREGGSNMEIDQLADGELFSKYNLFQFI